MLKRILGIVLMIFLVVIFVLFQNVVDNNNENNNLNGNETNVSNKEIFTISKDDTLDKKVSFAILNDQKGSYLEGEVRGEGHIILGKEETENKLTVYAITMYGEYGFQDGNFVKVSGSGTIPAVIEFTENDSNNDEMLAKINWPMDGSMYTESIESLFGSQYKDRALNTTKEDYNELERQEREYAKSYLKKIDRNTKIGDYRDFEHKLLTDLGVSVEVSNKISEDKRYAMFPFWIGNEEKIENNIRVVYEMNYDIDNNEIVLKKYNYETKLVIEEYVIDSLTGKEKSCITSNNTNLAKKFEKDKKIVNIYNFDKEKRTLEFDEIEWITLEDKDRIEKLNINSNLDMPNGYYIHNEETNKVTLNFSDKVTFNIINWGNLFEGDFNYQTNSIEEFETYLNTYENRYPPFWIQLDEDGTILAITEQYVP